MKAKEEVRLAEVARLKVEDYECAWMKVEEGFGLALESRQRVEED